jgi:hypothetical protein
MRLLPVKSTVPPVAASALLSSVPPCSYTLQPQFRSTQKACSRLQNCLATAHCETALRFFVFRFFVVYTVSTWPISLEFCCGPRSTFRITARHPPRSLSRAQPALKASEQFRRLIKLNILSLPSKARERPLSYNDQLHPGCLNSQSYRLCLSTLALLI